MNIAVGLIGAGVMGSEHARIVAQDTVGATLAGVCDADIGKAQSIAGYAPVCKDPLELINSSHTDAILIASPDATHAELVLACIKAGKPVLCEKPLALTSYQALAIVNAECRLGKKLVQVGYMRRFDPGYQELKARFYENALGAPEILHNIHRNPAAPEWMTGKMLITNAFVHEIDVARWLLRSELTSVSITAAEKGDPMVITARMSNGTIVSTELFMNCKYGYYVHAELVCSDGVISLPPFTSSIVSHAGQQLSFVPKNWIPRFRTAYQAQTNSWIKSIITGVSNGGATAWDGFVTTLVAEQLVEKVGSSQVIELATPACPELYL